MHNIVYMDELLTVKQVAILLKVHPLTVRRYIIEGKLKAFKMAGNVRISQNDLRSFSETYIHQAKSVSKQSSAADTKPFSVNDPFFQLRGRGLSIDSLNQNDK